MTKHVLLDNISHKDLKVKVGYEKNQGFDVSLVRVFPMELSQVQTEYPIFFTKNKDTGHFEPVALFGFSGNENLYLQDKGWDATYIPLSIQRQPFLIGFQEKVESGIPSKEPVVHIDIEHAKVNDGTGESVFLEHGGISPYLEHMTSILMTIHQGHEQNIAFSKTLVGLELIESCTMQVEFADGTQQSLTGLYAINEDKLSSLNGGALEVLHAKSYLQNIYMILASLPNVRNLVQRKDALKQK